MPDPGNLLQADVPMEEEEEGEEGGEQGEHHPPHQNGVRHHNGDVIGQASYVYLRSGGSGLDGIYRYCRWYGTGHSKGLDIV